MDEDDNEFKARSYQEQLLEIALKQNSIIYLPTGAGKTHIALMAMKEMSKKLNGPISKGGKRIAFMCNTIALAHQQYDVITKLLNLKAEVFTSEKNVDQWDRFEWEEQLEENQILVATCQVIVDIVCCKYISINNFALMIFDECHHAIGDHPMHRLMDLFRNADQQDLPRVIALTGTLLNSSKVNRMYQDLADLEAVFRGKIVTVENVDEYKNVLIYSTKPQELIIKYEDADNFDAKELSLQAQIHKIIVDCCEKISIIKIDQVDFVHSKYLFSVRPPNPITKTKNLLKELLFQMKDLGMYATSISCLAIMVELEMRRRTVKTENYKTMLRVVITCIQRINNLVCNKIYRNENESKYDVIMNNSTKKLKNLLLYLQGSFANKAINEVQCLLFVNRRYTAKVLCHIIKNISKEIPSFNVVPNFVVGKDGMADSIEIILENNKNQNVLNDFRENKCNLIVTTAVLEEGIDLQACNFVIIFDEIKTFRSYAQTKGRARMNDSKYVIMLPKSNYQKILQNIENFGIMDSKLKEYLIGKTIDRKMPTVEDIDRQYNDKFESFTSPIGAVLKPESAIPLLNRYCQYLYGEDCNSSTLSYSKEDLDNGYFRVKLLLPLLSTIKHEIWSDPMPNVKWAKRSAAFKACILLYNAGELNAHFFPTSHENIFDKLKPIYFEHLNKYTNDDPKTDTKIRRRQYQMAFPKQLFATTPESTKPCFLYEILISPKIDKENDNSLIFDLLNRHENYGILTSKELPKLAEINLFISRQQIIVKISANPISIILDTRKDIEKLKNFHLTIFRDVIQSTWSHYVAYNEQNEENSFLIVPTVNSHLINWKLVENFQKMPNKMELTEFQRKNLKINSKDYLYNVIIPWYNADKNQCYIVKSILNELNPTSKYPEKKYVDYIDYMKKMHNINVMQSDQFLITAEGIAFGDSNFLTLSTSKLKSKVITLIPELCSNSQFPGVYWLKAKLLPSILHRFHYYLHAENLRIEMNHFLSLKHLNYNPKPIILHTGVSELNHINDTDKKNDKNESFDGSEGNLRASMLNLFTELIDVNFQLEDIKLIDIGYHSYIKNQLLLDKNNLQQLNQFQPIKLHINKKRLPENNRTIKMLQIHEPLHGPEQYEIFQAITTTGAQDIFDNERLELLGDTFLKFSISLFLLSQNPTWTEGLLTSVKSQFVSNKNLLNLALKLRLPQKINTKKFQANRCLPPLISPPFNLRNLLLENDISETIFSELVLDEEEIDSGLCKMATLQKIKMFFNFHQLKADNDFSFLMNITWISDKVCADVVEALLGVCVKNYGLEKSFLILDYFGICPCKTNLLKEKYPNQRNSSNISINDIDEFLLNYTVLENNISYKFNDRGFLLAALTHPSYIANRLTSCYQQLEFIGDAIIDFLITMYIYEQCEDKTPGDLTDIRSALVNNVTFACIAVRYKLHLFLLAQSPSLSQSIMKFVEFQEKHNYEITDINLKGNESSKIIMSNYTDTPKILGDIFEAVIGAVFLDSSNNLEKTWEVLYGLMEYELNEFLTNVPIQVVRQLSEYDGARPEFYDVVVNNGTVKLKCAFYCRNAKHVVVGHGNSKKQAKNSAAKVALKILIES